MAMQRVNLLPDEARMGWVDRLLQPLDRGFPKIMAGSVAVLLAAGVALGVVNGQALAKTRGHLTKLREEIKLLRAEGQNQEAFIKQLQQVDEELQRQKKTVEAKLKYLQAYGVRPKVWAETLKDLRQGIPQGVWLTDLETGADRTLRIAGGAIEDSLVTQFMSNLKGSDRFTHVTFTYAEKDAIGNVPVVRFEIVCRVG